MAADYLPMNKREAIERGYLWKDEEEKENTFSINGSELPESIDEIEDTICAMSIGCLHAGACDHGCVKAFRIIPRELAFYRTMKVSLPRLCVACRHKERLLRRDPMRLWLRRCQCAGEFSENRKYQNTTPHVHGRTPCLNQFQSPYDSGYPESIYCEACYQSEVV